MPNTETSPKHPLSLEIHYCIGDRIHPIQEIALDNHEVSEGCIHVLGKIQTIIFQHWKVAESEKAKAEWLDVLNQLAAIKGCLKLFEASMPQIDIHIEKLVGDLGEIQTCLNEQKGGRDE
jgi:site-specific recombinase XerC